MTAKALINFCSLSHNWNKCIDDKMENIGIFCQAEALPYIASSSHLQWNYNGIKWYGWFMNGTILTYLKQYTILPVCSYLKWHYNGIKLFAIITPFVVPSTSACRKKSPPKIVEWIATREVAFYAAKKTLVAATLLTHPVNGAAIALCSLRNWVCSWLVRRFLDKQMSDIENAASTYKVQ